MGRAARVTSWTLTSALALLGMVVTPSSVAEACGGFFSRANLEASRRPSLAYEQALIVFDEAKQREHFVREVAFRRTSEPFGFVVPTPSRPEVAKVAASPFGRLRAAFAFEEPGEGQGFGGGIGRLGGGGTSRGVTVLDVKRVGSFTAFVLAADDEGALGRWLGENGFVTSKEAEPWLRHYVTRRFFFVAMRYEPPRDAAADPTPTPGRPLDPLADPPATLPTSTTSETIRISFDTPLPYYPYLEPDRPAGTDGGEGRLLEVWLVAKGLHAPVAARTRDGTTSWVQPMAEGRRYAPAIRTTLEDALGAEKGLLGAGELTVQRFMDQKVSRAGYGDVVFVPRAPGAVDAARRARLRRLVSVLDPSLPPSPPAGGTK